jgi:hypothetical protein
MQSPSKTYADVVKKVKDLANGGEEPSIVRSENVNFRELSFALSSTTNNSDIMEVSVVHGC